ncbi:unnamed protein product, partial [Symbiodinium sp. KB8]
ASLKEFLEKEEERVVYENERQIVRAEEKAQNDSKAEEARVARENEATQLENEIQALSQTLGDDVHVAADVVRRMKEEAEKEEAEKAYVDLESKIKEELQIEDSVSLDDAGASKQQTETWMKEQEEYEEKAR